MNKMLVLNDNPYSPGGRVGIWGYLSGLFIIHFTFLCFLFLGVMVSKIVPTISVIILIIAFITYAFSYLNLGLKRYQDIAGYEISLLSTIVLLVALCIPVVNIILGFYFLIKGSDFPVKSIRKTKIENMDHLKD